MPAAAKQPVCLIIAGPNGAGKTTFAREFLPHEGGIIQFVNADLIAAGLSPLRPANAALNAGRVFLSGWIGSQPAARISRLKAPSAGSPTSTSSPAGRRAATASSWSISVSPHRKLP